MNINTIHPRTGRIIKEDGTVINEADYISAMQNKDLRGLAADKPAANAVTAGTTYWSVDTQIVEVSTGLVWVVI